MNLRLNKAHYPVTVLGFGRRIGLWFQGCTLHCPGCTSQDTWESDPSKEIEVRTVLDWMWTVAKKGLDGVTISGGEPFEQPEALSELLDGLISMREDSAWGSIDLLCYSGMPLPRLQTQHADVLAKLDAIIPEPYVERLPLGGAWRGSSNQPLVPLSDLGRQRYSDLTSQDAPSPPRAFQIEIAGGSIWYIGIPDRGDMKRLNSELKARGVVQNGVSWRT